MAVFANPNIHEYILILSWCFVLVNGGYTSWTDWSICSRSCGPGITSRHRTCSQPFPSLNGKDCSDIGEAFEQKSCFLKDCKGIAYCFFQQS